MAIPSRFLKPTAKRPTSRKPIPINPTAVAVLLSVAAHGVFIAFGPRTSFSFAALSEEAQLQDVEEAIVPIVQLTPADVNRLPSFARPRPTPTPLDSLLLPGLSWVSPNTSRPNNSVPTPSRRLPPATSNSRQRFRQNAPSTFSTGSINSSRGLALGSARRSPRQAPPVELISPATSSETPDSSSSQDIPDLSGFSSSPSGIQLGDPSATGNGLPLPPGTRPEGEASSAGGLLSQELAAARRAENSGTGSASSGPVNLPDDNNDETGRPLNVEEPEAIATAPAQSDASRLLEGFEYDDTYVTPEEAEQNLEAWLVASAENKSDLATDTELVTIDSNFKVCKENPPVDGLIGVVVNPDGGQESIKVLKSIGYDILNRQALRVVELTDFGPPEQPTQYQVTVEVTYEPEGCVDTLPDTGASPDAAPTESP